jgi:hypothetical protein
MVCQPSQAQAGKAITESMEPSGPSKIVSFAIKPPLNMFSLKSHVESAFRPKAVRRGRYHNVEGERVPTVSDKSGLVLQIKADGSIEEGGLGGPVSISAV